MIRSYELGKIYEFSNDINFINRTIGVLVSYGQEDAKYSFEYYPLLEEYQRDTKYATYCREAVLNYKTDLFGIVYEH